jgi:predicted SAM-dependent methyltransferase
MRSRRSPHCADGGSKTDESAVLKLNLAAGTDARPPPWQNWDVTAWPNTRAPDRIWDARSDRIDLPDNSVAEICAGYLLLHVSRVHHEPLMCEMFRVLEPGGRIVVDEVNMRAAMQRWLDNPRDGDAANMVWGECGQAHGAELEEFDTHRSGHTLATLIELMTKCGFTRVGRIKIHDESVVWYALSLEGFKP